MKQILLLFCFALFAAGCQQLHAQCSNGRYYNQIFSANTTTTVQYGNAMKYDSTYQNLMADIYQPTGDNFAHRPLIILAFGGSFTGGIRQSPDLVILSTYFSQRGYVCACIDYRLGFPNGTGSDTNQFMALIRGVQDMKAAVRFFYKDAGTVNQYRIDTNQIFIGGVSAGAFMALNYGYLKQDTLTKPAPGFAIPAVISLGGLDGNSGSPGYSQKVKGVIDLCGGIADTVWIMPGDPILVGVHGTNDNNVACYYDSVLAITNTQSSLFGGGDIKNRLSHINLTDSFYLFIGAHHCPFIIPYAPTYNPVPWMDSTEWILRDFLYKNIVCDSSTIAGIEDPVYHLAVSIFPNPSNDVVSIVSRETYDMDVSVINMVGQLHQKCLLPANSTLSLSKENLGAGVYLLQFSEKGKQEVIKTDQLIFH